MNEYSDEQLAKRFPSMANLEREKPTPENPYPSMTREQPSPAAERDPNPFLKEPAKERPPERPPEAARQLDSYRDDASETEDGADDGGYDLRLPDGYEVNDEALGDFRRTADAMNLPAESRQQLLDLYGKVVRTEATARREQIERWAEEARSDPELSRDWNRNLRLGQTVVQQYGGDEVVELLNSTGLGNHRAVIRFLVKVGKDIKHLTSKI